MWPSLVFGFSGFQSAPPIQTTLPKGESMGPKGVIFHQMNLKRKCFFSIKGIPPTHPIPIPTSASAHPLGDTGPWFEKFSAAASLDPHVQVVQTRSTHEKSKCSEN